MSKNIDPMLGLEKSTINSALALRCFLLFISVCVTSLYYMILLSDLDLSIFGTTDVRFILCANMTELEPFFPNFALLIYLLSRSLLLGFPVLISILIIFLADPKLRKELTLSNLLLALTSTIIALVIAEFALRFMDQVPGQVRHSPWFHVVDELEELSGFTADQNGLFVVDTSIANECSIAQLGKTNRLDRAELLQAGSLVKLIPEVAGVHLDHQEMKEAAVSGQLQEKYAELLQSGCSDRFDSLLVQYVNDPINDQGFYSLPFDTMTAGRPRVLLLGDSFTWGHSTTDKTQSFSNILLSRELAVYNTGISGVDVPQYRRALETYVEALRPQVVVVNFFVGNDVEYFERTPQPGIPVLFFTNAGNIMAFQDGDQFRDPQSAYRNILPHLLLQRSGFFGWLAYRSVLVTKCWLLLERLGFVDLNVKFKERPTNIPVCNALLWQMIDHCKERNIRLIISAIPTVNGDKLDGVGSVEYLFENLPYHEPKMTIDMYNLENGHFNDKGHLFYANYLEQLIRNELGKETPKESGSED